MRCWTTLKPSRLSRLCEHCLTVDSGSSLTKVEEGAYCIDVLNQLVAVQRALQKTGERVLERHLRSCATTAIRGDRAEDRERVIEEIIDVFSAMGRS